MSLTENPPLRTISDVDLSRYDFVDLGAGVGGSLEGAEVRFGGRGLGVDLDAEKVREATAAGRDVVLGDITSLEVEGSVRFVVLDNVLEHLPTLDHVRATLEAAARVATDFIYVRHPSFEDEAYLARLGLKQYWTDWTGHPMHLKLADLAVLFRDLGLGQWEVSPVWRARDSSHPTVVPMSAPKNSGEYDPDEHDEKPNVAFDHPVWFAFDILVPLRTNRPTFRYHGDPVHEDLRPKMRWPLDDARWQMVRLRERWPVRTMRALAALVRARSVDELRAALVSFGRTIRGDAQRDSFHSR